MENSAEKNQAQRRAHASEIRKHGCAGGTICYRAERASAATARSGRITRAWRPPQKKKGERNNAALRKQSKSNERDSSDE